MDNLTKNYGLSPNKPAPLPTHPSQSDPPKTPPTIPPVVPPPLMSVTTFPEISSPPRKWRRKHLNDSNEMNSYGKLFDKEETIWQRFYIMSRKEGDFSKISPFVYCDQIIKAIGKPKTIQRMGSGSLNIEAISKEQAKVLSELKMLNNEEIIVESNKRLNTSKGVVVCRDFMICSEEEIKQGMSDQGVIEVRRINRRQGGTLVATASLILTFDRPEPPQQVEAAYYKLKVRRFIPSPMRCFKCLKFGHTSLRCRSSEQVCVCGLFAHENAPCQDPPICVNCTDLHSSRSPDCTVFQSEKEIQKIKTLQNLSYFEAREIVKSKNYVKPNVSFAAVTKTKQVERKDWQKFLQPFVFSANQGPPKPVWMTQETSKQQPSSSKDTPTLPHEARVNNPSFSESQGKSLTLLPTPLPPALKAEQQQTEFRLPVRLASSRLPPRSPPRKVRPPRQTLPSTSVSGTVSQQQVMTGVAQPQKPHLPPISTLNWSSSREDNESDPDTGDSNRTVLSDAGQTPMERPVVRRKRKGKPKLSKK